MSNVVHHHAEAFQCSHPKQGHVARLGKDDFIVGFVAFSAENGITHFTLNLLRARLISQATCSDISEGMLATLQTNARRLALPVRTVCVDAERLPFADQSFDLVLGHAVLHHLPDLAAAFAEFERVLAPGGVVLFAGEPSRVGDALAGVPKRAAAAAAPWWRLAIGARAVPPAGGRAGNEARDAALERVTGEELLANWFGWANRTLEATAEPADVPWAWRQYAYRGYLLLQEVDRRLLEPRLPAAVFYNLMISARKAWL